MVMIMLDMRIYSHSSREVHADSGGQWGFGGFEFDLGDLFSGGWATKKKSKTPPKEEEKVQLESLDVTEIVEIPFLDFLYETSLSVKNCLWKGAHSQGKTWNTTRNKVQDIWKMTNNRWTDGRYVCYSGCKDANKYWSEYYEDDWRNTLPDIKALEKVL
jgi:hypothetical protein